MIQNAHPHAPAEPIGTSNNQHGGLVQLDIVLQGTTPLLMNAMPADRLLGIWNGPGSGKKGRAAARPKPFEAAKSALHCLPDGRPHIPLRALMATFINAGQLIRLDGKRQISTDKKTILPMMLSILSTELPLTLRDGKVSARWEVDIQQGRNPNGGETVCLIRPRFDEWQFSVLVEVDRDQMPESLARELIDKAGRAIGLLEFTPRHKGTYGCFKVVKWETVSPLVP